MLLFRLGAVLITIWVIAGCAWPPSCAPPEAAVPPQPIAASLPASLLPPLPVLRMASLVFTTEINGADFYSRSANAVAAGSALELHSASNAIAFGIWQFSPHERAVSSVQAVLSLPAGDLAYIALADYRSGCWEICGPFSAGIVLPLDEARHKSVTGNCCVAVITAQGDAATVHKLVLDAESAWQLYTVDSAGNVGRYTSLAVVDGNPAISFCAQAYEGTVNALRYIRAEDVQGSSWGTAVTLREGLDFYGHTSLAVVNGNPAISFEEATYFGTFHGGALVYIRAGDALGNTWGDADYLDYDPLNGDYLGQYSSLRVVNGRPAIGYCGAMGTRVLYKQACDANGSAWEPSAVVSTGKYCALVENYEDLPVICFFDEAGGKLRIAGADFAGTWNPPTLVDGGTDAVGSFCSMARVSLDLGISYYNETQHDLKYAWYNPMSSDWDIFTLDSSGDVGSHTSLAVINGRPCVSYYDADLGNLKFIAALDSKGASWGSPETVDAADNVGTYGSLAEVDGKPAISYYSETNGDLRFAIRLDP